MAGRPKPRAAATLKGNPGKRPGQPVNHLPGLPPPPSGLPKEAQAEWRRVSALLRGRGDLSELDQAGLADYCVCKVRLEQCEADISKRGVLIDGARGPVKNPALQIARTYRAALAKWVDLFGLAPGPRGRLAVAKVEIDDDPDGMFR